MTHPAGIPESARLWWGEEIENDRKGLRTAFLAGPLEPLEEHAVVALAAHVFFTDRCDLRYAAELARRLRAPVAITVEVPMSRARYRAAVARMPSRTVVVVRLPLPWASELRAQDEVSVGADYTLLTWRVGSAVKAVPDDYRADHV